MSKQHVIFDTEIIGTNTPIFLVCCKIVETGDTFAFWHDKRGHTKKLAAMLANPDYTWVGFNSENFDRPLIAMAVMGHDEANIKTVAQHIIEDKMMSWQTYREYDIDFLEYDHIDIKEVPPGVMLSLKIYEGRMHSPRLQDMPFHHDHDVTAKERKLVEEYCFNDVEETERLFQIIREQISLREQLSEQYDVDLRSKSDAQCAEAILKKVCAIGKKDKVVPGHVRYTCPSFIKTDSALINEIIELCEEHKFIINHANGSPEFPEFLTEPIKIGAGVYQMGIGGLHSQHDVSIFLQNDDTFLLSDFDVASYYPNIMMKAGLIPNLGGNKGELFLDAYQDIYEQRMTAKRAGDKATANTLKIVLNGTFGKLGSIFCSFYAPELMLAVTITGQLNLLCLIHDLNKIKGVTIESANTDGIMVRYPVDKRNMVLKKIQANAKRTGFDYEETPYRCIAMKDVNNYFAVTAEQMAAVIEPGSVAEAVAKSMAARAAAEAADVAAVAEPDAPLVREVTDESLETQIVPRVDDPDLAALFGEAPVVEVEAPRFADEEELASLANFTVTLDSGESVIVNENALLGRMPQPAEGEHFEHLIVVVDPSRSVSKTHLELGIDGTSIWISDRNSGNGSIVREPGVVPRRAQPGMRYEVVRGTRIDIGDQHLFIN